MWSCNVSWLTSSSDSEPATHDTLNVRGQIVWRRNHGVSLRVGRAEPLWTSQQFIINSIIVQNNKKYADWPDCYSRMELHDRGTLQQLKVWLMKASECDLPGLYQWMRAVQASTLFCVSHAAFFLTQHSNFSLQILQNWYLHTIFTH
jgi:hypothetical protein